MVQQMHSTAAAAAPTKPNRPDLDPGYTSGNLVYQNAPTASVIVPAFTLNPSGNGPSQYTPAVQNAPKLDQGAIKRIKAEALKKLSSDMQQKVNQVKQESSVGTDGKAGFSHPGGITSAAELVLMKNRLDSSLQPQLLTRHCLVSGQKP